MADETAPPDWFPDAFRQALARLGWRLVRWQGLSAVVAHPDGQEHSYGFGNLIRKTAPAPPGERVDRIVEHLRGLSSVRPPDKLNGVRERLFPRLRLPAEDDGPVIEAMWSAPFLETGLDCVLVVDFPEAVTYVTREMVEESGRPGEDWFRLAVDNLRVSTSAEMIVEVDEVGLLAVGTADTYDAVRGLLLEEFFPHAAPNGFIASVPNRDRLYFYPVGERTADRRFARLLIETLKEHREGAYAICDTIFWIHKGRWERVEWEWDGESLFVDFPAALKGLLGEGKGQGDE